MKIIHGKTFEKIIFQTIFSRNCYFRFWRSKKLLSLFDLKKKIIMRSLPYERYRIVKFLNLVF